MYNFTINQKGDTFRPTFVRLGELRSHFPDVPYLLLTATCTQQVLQHIAAKIHLPCLKLFTASPDRLLYVMVVVIKMCFIVPFFG